MFLLPRAGLEHTNENTGVEGGSEQNRSLLAERRQPPDMYLRFSELLRSWDFTPTQLVLISDAMREAGLVFAEAPEVAQ